MLRYIFLITSFSPGRNPNVSSQGSHAPIRTMAKTLRIPYVRQRMYYCGPACLEMALRFYDINKNQSEIANAINTMPYFGYTIDELMEYTNSLGLQAELKERSTIGYLVNNVNHDIPTLVLQWQTIDQNERHYRTVIGYEPRKIIFHDPDPEFGDSLYLSNALFEELWTVSKNRISLAIKKR